MGSLISSVGDLLGGASNNAGTVAQAAPLIQPVTAGQVNQATGTATGAINTQQGLVNALAGQNAQGINTQSNLTNALTNEANGVGPNPAQAQLAQNTGQNIAQQAALEAGQRGASSNVGLEARQIGQQGAGIQQNAVGQAATLQAQQQLAAQQQLQNLAGTQIGQNQTAIGNLNNAAQTNQGQLLGALQGYNANQVANTSSQNSANAGIAQTNANNTAKTVGTLLPAVGSIAAAGAGIPLAKGGEAGAVLAKVLAKKKVPDHLRAMAEIYHPKLVKMADGGAIDQPIPNEASSGSSDSEMSEALPLLAALAANKGAVVPGEPKVNQNNLKNDVVPAMLTPKEIVLPLSVTQAKNPGEAAKAFVEKIKGQDKGEKMNGDFKEALKKHVANRKNKK